MAGSILGVTLFAAALAACAHHNAQSAGGKTPEQPQAVAAGTCSLAQLRGVHASVADIRGGVAIALTGPHNELDKLRDNVKAMVDANDKHGDAFAACPCALAGRIGAAEAMPSEPGQRGRTSMQPGTGGTALPRADAKFESASTGAVLRLTAKDSSHVDALRAAARQDVRVLRKSCLQR
jgi:hypothetical protein